MLDKDFKLIFSRVKEDGVWCGSQTMKFFFFVNMVVYESFQYILHKNHCNLGNLILTSLKNNVFTSTSSSTSNA